jgi:hypothetical protein
LILLTGLGATALTDLWALLRRRLFGTALPNYRLVGRWLGRMRLGEFRHEAIARANALRGESLIGWAAHYLIGAGFAALLVWFAGTDWLARPTWGAALLIGLATVTLPFLVMQPAMGAGVAASRAPNPAAARLHSVVYHLVFGAGLYLSARIIALAISPAIA